MKKIIIKSVAISLLYLQSSSAQTWNQVGNGTQSPITCFIENSGKLYVGGYDHIGFTSIGVASWDGLQWDSIGNSIYPIGTINSIAYFNNEIIIGGLFAGIDTISNTKNIAAWNGTQWHSLGTGMASSVGGVYALEVFNGELYVGGSFTTAGGVSCQRIARWNGTNWSSVGSGVTGGMPTVYSLCTFNNELYVGGSFYYAGGIPANCIARWNGTQWDSVGVGVYGYVFDMLVDSLRNNLIIGGNFANVDTSFGWCVAAWDGNQILPIGKGLFHAPQSMCFYNNILLVTQANGDTTLMYWDSLQWNPILGISGRVSALKTYKNEMYVGGYFDSINNVPFSHIARYTNPTLGITKIEGEKQELFIFPNPSNGKITMQYQLPPGIGNAGIKIYDYGGKLVKALKIRDRGGNIALSEGILPKGVYIASLIYRNGKKAVKFVVE